MKWFIMVLLGFTIYLTNGEVLEFDISHSFIHTAWGKWVIVRERLGTVLKVPADKILYIKGNDK